MNDPPCQEDADSGNDLNAADQEDSDMEEPDDMCSWELIGHMSAGTLRFNAAGKLEAKIAGRWQPYVNKEHFLLDGGSGVSDDDAAAASCVAVRRAQDENPQAVPVLCV